MNETLVATNDPILHKKLDTFDFSNPPIDPIGLVQRLVKFTRDDNGLGLSANQLGLPYRVFVMRANPNIACFNPRIVQYGDEKALLEEGCLSYPGYFVKIKRSKHIRVRFEDANGETQTETYTGMAARVFQHELDHLDGIVFIKRATRFHKEQADRQFAKRLRMSGKKNVAVPSAFKSSVDIGPSSVSMENISDVRGPIRNGQQSPSDISEVLFFRLNLVIDNGVIKNEQGLGERSA